MLREAWDEQADAWAVFARTEGHDPSHAYNLEAFLEFLPQPGRRTLDLGCGEGRVGAELVDRGYDVVGVDASPRMVEYARERHEALVADASDLPFEDGAFDLVVAYMSLMNMDDLERAVQEAGRVLAPAGVLCAAVVHPLWTAGARPNEDVLVIAEYFDAPVRVWEDERDGIKMTFYDRVIPLESYARALEDGGFVIERLRELPSRRCPALPLFLHFRAVNRAQ